MVVDHQSPKWHQYRENLSVVVLPIQSIVNAPIQWVHWLGMGVTAQKHLLEENARLKVHDLLLQSKITKSCLALEKRKTRS